MKELARAQLLEPDRGERIANGGKIVAVWLTATVLVSETGEAYAIATTEREIRGQNENAVFDPHLEEAETMSKKRLHPDRITDLRRRAEKQVRADEVPDAGDTLARGSSTPAS